MARFKPRMKPKLEMTELEAIATLEALDDYKHAAIDRGENTKALAAGRVMGRLGVELARVGAGKLGSARR